MSRRRRAVLAGSWHGRRELDGGVAGGGQRGRAAITGPVLFRTADVKHGTPNSRMLCVKGGIDPARLYQFTYDAARDTARQICTAEGGQR